MNGSRGLSGGTALLRPAGDPEGVLLIERIIVSLRLAIVVCTTIGIAVGIDPMGRHREIAFVVVGVAIVYALLLMKHPHWEGPGTRTGVAITVMDISLSLSATAVTGGAESPAGTILFLAVIATATRLGLVATMTSAVAIGVAYMVIALVADADRQAFAERLQTGLWWFGYLLFTAILAAGLARYAARAYQAQAEARAEAIAEHSVATEERDLRARLLSAHQAQRDGLRAILHDFRTPVSSMKALAAELADSNTKVEHADRETALRLVSAHADYLSAMLDALADVAVSRNPALPSGRREEVVLRDFLLAAGDAAGLRPPHLRLMLTDSAARVRVDAQRLRRVLTNLLDNANRHGGQQPIEMAAGVVRDDLTVRIRDRGPGMTPEELRVATRKDVSLGDSGGQSGLGLWIVEQIVQSLNGDLELKGEPGGGLLAQLRIPLS